MTRFFRVVGMLLGVIVGLVAVAAGFIYFSARAAIDKRYPLPAVAAVAIPTDSASIAEGRRIAMTRGCYAGCHGKTLEGGLFLNEPGVGRMVTPNLTEAVRKYSDAELVAILREGLRPDGHSVLAMPSEMSASLTDEDLGKLIAYLKSEPQVPGATRVIELGPLAYLGVTLKQYRTARDLLEELRAMPAEDLPDSLAHGRYLTMTLCIECHGTRLQGDPIMKSPPLGIVAGYEPHEFSHLLRTGEPKGGQKLTLMAEASKGRFVHLTDSEVDDLYRYLRDHGSAPATAAASKP